MLSPGLAWASDGGARSPGARERSADVARDAALPPQVLPHALWAHQRESPQALSGVTTEAQRGWVTSQGPTANTRRRQVSPTLVRRPEDTLFLLGHPVRRAWLLLSRALSGCGRRPPTPAREQVCLTRCPNHPRVFVTPKPRPFSRCTRLPPQTCPSPAGGPPGASPACPARGHTSPQVGAPSQGGGAGLQVTGDQGEETYKPPSCSLTHTLSRCSLNASKSPLAAIEAGHGPA